MRTSKTVNAPPALRLEKAADCRFRLCGSLNVYSVAGIWEPLFEASRQCAAQPFFVDCEALDYCDTAGIALFVELLRTRREAAHIENLAPAYQSLLNQFDPKEFGPRPNSAQTKLNLIEVLGRFGSRFAAGAREQIGFIGEAGVALGHTFGRPQALRWRDALAIAEEVGVNALPIVALIACLMGVIMAFQSAVAMRQFGAEIFVANLVGLSLLRELGPLMTAILLAGRSAAAFAAEIGTMKVNDEISALSTMGLDPVRFLVVPRMLAGLLMTPLLTIFADLIGLLGGGLVMLLFNIPLVTYFNQLLTAVQPGDFFGGLVKSFVFGLLIAGVGCLRGLQTGQGAAAVGISATRAVVSALVLIVVADGIFAVLYYHLNV
ncbi:MAG TPA: MlaE family lipid ABC transporter permease subunit [Burkholderiales bacterium]|nr:MlaE family lipid ABC transporter permease subunit [Burkholderiales bacterium]